MPGKQELPHNTLEQVKGYLVAALLLVEETDPPEDLRVAAFTGALGLISSKQIFYEQAPALNGPLMIPPRG